ncbi:hypothetical protein L1987_51173 [Smallanthus sonchifolius]|uniref:Uncharacterized protein n=1 Tax=Smallanthus sonchifolius TaxID=185202 RepID=A0ACB9EPK2_9ASTR|nr:hypothetical protein L1987_51173 [Smallanthus sonchifolius]
MSFVISILAAGIVDEFTQVDSHDKFQVMVSMYEVEKELSIYVMTNNNFETSSMQQRGTGDVDDEESEYSLSDESYHSRYSTDEEVEEENSAIVIYQYKHRTIKVNSRFDIVIEFRRALAHY